MKFLPFVFKVNFFINIRLLSTVSNENQSFHRFNFFRNSFLVLGTFKKSITAKPYSDKLSLMAIKVVGYPLHFRNNQSW
jgi:hypothetical protein